jgi:class 3 adenylate cyclase
MGLLSNISTRRGSMFAVKGPVKFSDDLLGDTVNTASRMESQGAVGCIQVMASCGVHKFGCGL